MFSSPLFSKEKLENRQSRYSGPRRREENEVSVMSGATRFEPNEDDVDIASFSFNIEEERPQMKVKRDDRGISRETM